MINIYKEDKRVQTDASKVKLGSYDDTQYAENIGTSNATISSNHLVTYTLSQNLKIDHIRSVAHSELTSQKTKGLFT